MTRRLLFIACLLAPNVLNADKLILKDGTVLEGRIMGETRKTILISNPPSDPTPHFVKMEDIQTIVRQSHPREEPSTEEQRFASVSAGVQGQLYSSRIFSFSPASSLYFGGAFRLHPFVELGGEFHYTPSLSGSGLAISDGTHLRSYDSFYAYDGGFSAKFFPFFKYKDWRWEPYLVSGYEWSRLVPKASGDELSGQTVLGGVGVMLAWWKPLYWDARFTYGHTQYDSVRFLGGDGGLNGVTNDSFSLSLGLSYRFL